IYSTKPRWECKEFKKYKINDAIINYANLNFIVCWVCEISFQTAKARHLRVCFVTFTSGIIVAIDKYQPFVLPRVSAAKTRIVNK
ncbi:hypothetical protein, partial [Enterobacter hormaechei]|uniref:hypothetical protein n=1 Tax=Enterobacter hormaechei TaxID=158836 RepID=UPI001C12BC04